MTEKSSLVDESLVDESFNYNRVLLHVGELVEYLLKFSETSKTIVKYVEILESIKDILNDSDSVNAPSELQCVLIYCDATLCLADFITSQTSLKNWLEKDYKRLDKNVYNMIIDFKDMLDRMSDFVDKYFNNTNTLKDLSSIPKKRWAYDTRM